MLDVVVEEDAGNTVVTITGPVDSATLDLFKDQIEPPCCKPGAKVLLDCKGMTYLNSRAIGLLMKWHRQLMMSRGRFVMCNLNQKLVRTLELLHIGKDLNICKNREEALAALR